MTRRDQQVNASPQTLIYRLFNFPTDCHFGYQRFASKGQDVNLNIVCHADRRSALTALTVDGLVTDNGSQPHNFNARIHCSQTNLAEDNSRYVANGELLHNLSRR